MSKPGLLMLHILTSATLEKHLFYYLKFQKFLPIFWNYTQKKEQPPSARVRNFQGIGIKGREMALVWHEKASRTALQTSSVLYTHTLLVQTHNMTTVKEIFLEYL